MTLPITQDELGLAEAVAAGELSLEDAEARLDPAAGSRTSARDTLDLHRTVAAIQAVRAHARATLALGTADESLGGRVPTLLPGAPADGAGRAPVPTGRPGIVTPVLAGPVRSRSRRAPDGRALAVAASFVVVASALGWAFAGSRTISPSPRPSANGLATFATTGPSVPPAAAAFKAADHPEVFDAASQFALTSATVGWLRTYDPTSRTSRLFRTIDAGRTWTQLSVAPVGIVRVVDDTTTYVETVDSSILVTHDGGVTWRAATIDARTGAVGPWFLTVAGPDVAFATFAGSEASTNLLVYSTSDGGATWSGPTQGTVAVLDSSYNKPQGGDNGLLWMTLGKADNKPFDNRVAISADGGATWTIQPLPTDSAFSDASPRYPTAIRHDAGRETLVGSDGDATGIYTTTDAGQTWTGIHTWPRGAIVELRSASAWTATTATAFWSTTDGGRTWRQTPRDAEPPVVGVTFATPDVGWAEVVCSHRSWQPDVTPDPICQGRTTGVVFMATADGGTTWAPIAP